MILSIVPHLTLARAAELTATRTFTDTQTASGIGTIIHADPAGLTASFAPFDPAYGTLTGFTITWNLQIVASGTVDAAATSGSFYTTTGGNARVNAFNYNGGGNGGGTGGEGGTALGPITVPRTISQSFLVSDASLPVPPYNPAILPIVRGASTFDLSFVSNGNVAGSSYSNLSSFTSTLTASVTLTYTYTPLPPFRTVENFAGSGTSGSTDGSAASARFNGPWGISRDALGNLYGVDYSGKRVRKVTPAGEVSFLDAFTNFPPIATAIDPATGNLYVAIETHRILRYANKNAANYPTDSPVYGPETDFADSVIVWAGANASGTTNATGTAARFNAPSGLAVHDGFLYVADKGNHAVRKIDLSTAAVTTVGLTGGTLNAPEGILVDAAGVIYVACTGSDLIQKIATDGSVATLAGSTAGYAEGTGASARFSDPRGLAMDTRGDLFVADSGNHAIRRISPAGVVTTIAGGSATGAYADGLGSAASFNSPRGLAYGLDGWLYVTDFGNHRIRRVNATQPVITVTPASLAGFTADFGNPSAARTFDLAGSALAGSVTVTAPAGFEVSTDGNSYSASVTSSAGSTLHVRISSSAPAGAFSGNLTLDSDQATPVSLALSGTVSAVLEASVASLDAFSTVTGSASAAQSFTLAGSGLGSAVTIEAPEGYEVSTDGQNFSSSVTLGTLRPGSIQGAWGDKISNMNFNGRFPNANAFAAITGNGSVVAWGRPANGGDSSAVDDQLQADVTAVYSNSMAFAALKSDGSLVTWGNSDYGGDSSSVAASLESGVTTVYSNNLAFAALKSDGSVVTWGYPTTGGDSSSVGQSLHSGVTAVYSNANAFAALKNDGSVVTWGYAYSGGDSSGVATHLQSGVTAVYSTDSAFAAVKNDGSVVTWGTALTGGDSSSVAANLSSGVTTVFSTYAAFAALKNDGSVVTWGNSATGGDSSSVAVGLTSGVTSVASTWNAFAAVKNDGSVVTWGDTNYGGAFALTNYNSSEDQWTYTTPASGDLASGVTAVYSNGSAFAALKNDGSAFTWGYAPFGGDSSRVAASLSLGVTAIYSAPNAFAAVKTDGSVITWGDANKGGDSSSVAASLSSGVTAVYSTSAAFAALKNDGSVVTWGDANYGGTGGPGNIESLTPPSFPVTLHIRLASTARIGPVTGSLTISAEDATTRSIDLSGTVTEEQTVYTHHEEWRFANFGSYASENSGADSADPDHDGMTNLLEYALGQNPNTGGTTGATLTLTGGNLEYTYTRSTAAKDNGVTYQIEWSDTLAAGSWSTEGVAEEIQSTQDALETVKATIPAGTGAKRFLRLQVVK